MSSDRSKRSRSAAARPERAGVSTPTRAPAAQDVLEVEVEEGGGTEWRLGQVVAVALTLTLSLSLTLTLRPTLTLSLSLSLSLLTLALTLALALALTLAPPGGRGRPGRPVHRLLGGRGRGRVDVSGDVQHGRPRQGVALARALQAPAAGASGLGLARL